MMFPRIAVVAYDSSHDFNILKPIHKMDFLVNTEIHIVHIVKRVFYGDGLSFNVTFLEQEDQAPLRIAIINTMKDFVHGILPTCHVGKVKFECIFGDDPKEDFCRYLQSSKADLGLIASREKHGFFDSSFAYYVSTHAPCSVIVTRSKEF